MHKMIVVVFPDQDKALAGYELLDHMQSDGGFSFYAGAVIAKGNSNAVTVIKSTDDSAFRVVGGMALGALIGLLGGPGGVALGSALGAIAGVQESNSLSWVNEEFLTDVKKGLDPGKFALVARVDENWTTTLDAGMKRLGGHVLRWNLDDIESDFRA